MNRKIRFATWTIRGSTDHGMNETAAKKSAANGV